VPPPVIKIVLPFSKSLWNMARSSFEPETPRRILPAGCPRRKRDFA
jgi:hypothetical protein